MVGLCSVTDDTDVDRFFSACNLFEMRLSSETAFCTLLALQGLSQQKWVTCTHTHTHHSNRHNSPVGTAAEALNQSYCSASEQNGLFYRQDTYIVHVQVYHHTHMHASVHTHTHTHTHTRTHTYTHTQHTHTQRHTQIYTFTEYSYVKTNTHTPYMYM